MKGYQEVWWKELFTGITLGYFIVPLVMAIVMSLWDWLKGENR